MLSSFCENEKQKRKTAVQWNTFWWSELVAATIAAFDKPISIPEIQWMLIAV
jgi:hypothetical protein